MATTDTNLDHLIINDLTREQYDAAVTAGQINDNEFYLTPDPSVIINNVTQEQYDAAAAAGQINDDELYLTPDTSIISLTTEGTKITCTKGDGTSTDAQITFNDGTPGLQYTEHDSYAECTGLGTAADTDIHIASIYNGKRVTSIFTSAFSHCTSLTTITIPDSVTSIGDSAFESCTNLQNIIIPNSVISIGAYAFKNCSNLLSIVIPDGVTVIAPGVFTGCTSLKSVTMGNSITSIEDYAFVSCSSLTSITIPDSVTRIGSYAFENCSSLAYMTIPFVGDTKNGPTYPYFGYIFGAATAEESSTSVPASLKEVVITNADTISSYAFKNCTNLTSVTISDSVTSIGDGVFSGCSALQNITLPFVGGSKDATSASSSTLFGYIFGT